jgi:hypothetical protein
MRTFETDIAALLGDEEPTVVKRFYDNEPLAEEELAEVDNYINHEIELYFRDMAREED